MRDNTQEPVYPSPTMPDSQLLPRRNRSEAGPSSTSTTSPPSQLTPESESDEEESDLEVYAADEYIKGEAHELKALRRDSSASTLGEENEDDLFNAEREGYAKEEGREGEEKLSQWKRRQRRKRRLRWTEEEEQAMVKKFDRRLVLFLALLYMLSFLDRSSEHLRRSSSLDGHFTDHPSIQTLATLSYLAFQNPYL